MASHAAAMPPFLWLPLHLQAPALMTGGRSRPTQFKSLEQRELEELEAIPKFHATRLK